MDYNFRKALPTEKPQIWKILQQAIERRKQDGSKQWQDGYPNEEVIQKDIERGIGYILTKDNIVAGYTAVLFNDEPAYHDLKGKWLTNGDFAVMHRIAISDDFLGQGLAQQIMLATEQLAIENGIFSIKVDTNFDNIAMLRIFEKLGYTYCGEVTFRGGVRKAFEKVLIK